MRSGTFQRSVSKAMQPRSHVPKSCAHICVGDLFIVNGFNENVIAEVSLTDPDIAGEGDGNDGDGNDSAEVDWDY